jgi:NAD(P)H-nitrite reductase large subunit
MKVCVDRCVCFDRPFVDLLAVARAHDIVTLEALQEETDFGLACRICNPYVRRMLRTGQTTFAELLNESDEPNSVSSDTPEKSR